MTEMGLFQVIVYLAVILALVKPLGWYMTCVYQGIPCGLNQLLNPLERIIYRLCGIQPEQEMDWITYLTALLFFNALGLLVVYAIQRLQLFLPLNPEHFPNVSPMLAFNTAASFVTNTDWQAYSGENSLSYLTQMLALTVQNFLSAATGMSLLMALIRGMVRHETSQLGNFWVDILRGTLYILLPLSLVLSLILASQGVIQNFKPYQQAHLLQPFTYQQTAATTTQILPMGPVASQIAIKQLGTNGGGYFNANSAHPFENPTPLTNFLEMLALILIPAALCYTFGMMARDKRQGWAILLAMLIIFIPITNLAVMTEQKGNPDFAKLNIYPSGNMEGKETRFGVANSTLWASAATASGNGSTNAAIDSFIPLSGLAPLWLMQLGEVVWGGVGSGLSGMLIVVIITVFMAGLMVGRTPEYLGKKIEPYEMKMASLAVLIMPFIVLILTAIAVVTRMGTSSITNSGTHGFTEILYAFSSMANNNGSAFAGLNANTMFYNVVGGIAMLIGRYWIAIPTLAIAGSLARKKIIPKGLGTLPTHTPLFILLLVSVTIIIGALTFFPALALGPIVEQLMLGKF
jgi:K+-transporting ATPase ATPase A chain